MRKHLPLKEDFWCIVDSLPVKGGVHPVADGDGGGDDEDVNFYVYNCHVEV